MNYETIRFHEVCISRMADIFQNHLSKHALSTRLSCEDVFAFAESVLYDKLLYDIERLVQTDPATKKAYDQYSYVLNTYKGLEAILYYRLANHLIYNVESLLMSEEIDEYKDPLDEEQNTHSREMLIGYYHQLARNISEDAAKRTTIEINPAAKIGKGFVIDHGTNTKIEGGIVLGETCIIGDNCTILNGVLLGASDVNKGRDQTGRRHPKIGAGVTICANVRILGAVTIGDNVIIGPHCVITKDIPADVNVNIVNQLQMESVGSCINEEDKLVIWGLVPNISSFSLYGRNLANVNLSICSCDTHSHLQNVNIISCSSDLVVFNIGPEILALPKEKSLCIKSNKQIVYLFNSLALSGLSGKYKQEI